MFRISASKDNVVSATYQLLKAIGAKVTEGTLEETLKNHPEYPSILAVSDAFNKWNIDNLSIRITSEQLFEVSPPFIAWLNIYNGIFVLVKKTTTNTIEWVDREGDLKIDTKEEFLEKWNGIVLLAETNESSGEKDYNQKRKKEKISKLRIPFLILGVVLLQFSLFYNIYSYNWLFISFFALNIFGSIISCFLIWQRIDKNNPLINNICQIGNKSNCNAILNSKAANITSWLSWSEVGFFYFTGNLFTLMIEPTSLFFLQIFTFFSLFYIFWSLYYQAFVAKEWCILCLTTLATLFLQFIITICNYSFYSPANSFLTEKNFISVIQGFSLPILLWTFLKPIFTNNQKVSVLTNNLRRFKNNPDLFLSLLHQQENMPLVNENLNAIIQGSINAAHTITIVTNPFCNPCAKAHKIIETLLDTNENLNCQIIFAASDSEEDNRNIIARSILSQPTEKQAFILSKWNKHEDDDIKKWEREMPLNEYSKEILYKHIEWIKNANVKSTPTIFFNGYRIPQMYQLEDLENILYYLPSSKVLEKSN
jgi:uncharacterized membrane protein/glutaredoxin